LILSAVWAVEPSTGREIIDGINKHFTANPKPPVPYWFPVTITVFASLLIIWVIYQICSYFQKIDADNPWSLYKQLCKVHHLNFIEKRVIHKLLQENQLNDPLPIFVEPEYLKKAIDDDSLKNDRMVVQILLDKLFQPEIRQQANRSTDNDKSSEVKEIIQESPAESSLESMQQIQTPEEKNLKEEVIVSSRQSFSHFEDTEVKKMSGKNEEEIHFEEVQKENQAFSENGKNNGKVLLSPIPGERAFSSLAEPVGQISSEIAAVAIQYNLSNGYGLNSRSFECIHRQQHEAETENSPHLFPKSQTPPTVDILSEQRISRTDKHAVASPTPKYLQEKRSSAEKTKSHPQTSENSGRLHLPKAGEMFTMEDIHLLESIVMKR
jgi:hypothetical protein